MKRIETKFEAFILGFLVSLVFFWFIPKAFFPVQYYQTKEELILDNNIVIPKNTEFTLYQDMPEGYKIYAFSISLDYIDDKVMKKTRVIQGGWIPSYWAIPKNTEKRVINLK